MEYSPIFAPRGLSSPNIRHKGCERVKSPDSWQFNQCGIDRRFGQRES